MISLKIIRKNEVCLKNNSHIFITVKIKKLLGLQNFYGTGLIKKFLNTWMKGLA